MCASDWRSSGTGTGQGLHYAILPLLSRHVSILLGLAACSDQVRVTVIDGELFPDAAQKIASALRPR
jgi:hypothetical protein